MAEKHESMRRFYAVSGRLTPPLTSQTDIARALNTSPQRVSNWENCRGISKDAALDAQRLLGVSATYLLNGEGPMLVGQSQPARLTGEMIRSAYRDAVDFAAQGGAEAGDFNPGANPDDAGILALMVNRLLSSLVSTSSGAREVG